MTVQTSTTVATGIGNGVTTVFPIGFKFNQDEDLIVNVVDSAAQTETLLTLYSDYTVSGAGDENGGSITLTAGPLPTGKSVVTKRVINVLQLTDLRNQGKFFAEVHEDSFDKGVMIDQQQQEQLDRTLSFDLLGRWNAFGRRIINVGAPIQSGDATRKDYVDAGDQASRNYADDRDAANFAKTLRTTDSVGQIGSSASRANKLLSFDSAGNPATVAPPFESAAELAMRLADTADPLKGISIAGFVRSVLSQQITNAAQLMSAQYLGLWEFAKLVTSKPTPADPSTWDWTPAVNGMIDAAATTYKGWIATVPAGVFPITRLIRRRGVKIVGMGSRSTSFVALPFDPADGKPYGMSEIEAGPVAGAGMTGIAFYGSAAAVYGNPVVNPDQWGFYCHAQFDAGNIQGGFWHSKDEDIAYWNFNKGVWSRGGYTDAHSRRPNQFIDYCNIQVGVQAGGEAWRFTGQHGQINLINGYGEGLNPAGFAYANIAFHATWDPDPSTTAKDGVHGESVADVAGVGNAARAPTNINLSKGFSLQKCRKAILLKGATRNIDAEGCWIEKTAEAVTLENSAALSVRSTRFANAADGAVAGVAGSGHIVKQSAGTMIDWGDGNVVSGVVDSFLASSSASNNDIAGYNFNGPLGLTTTSAALFPARGAKVQQISAAGVIDVAAHPFCFVQNNADRTIRLVRIDGRQMPGMQILLRASGGPITLRSTGNIVTGQPRDITMPSGGMAVLQRLMPSTNGSDWALLSTSEHFDTAPPTDGYYYSRGHVVSNSTPSPGGIPRWVCVTEGLAGTTAAFMAEASLA